MSSRERGYQRAHLRAPYQEPVLFGDEDFIHKARSLNISEGGILLDEVPEFPAADEVPLLLHLPSYPYFKNFNLIKMQTFTRDLFPTKVIRAKGRMVRRIGETTSVDDVFRPRFGIQFSQLGDHEQKYISEYVSVFASNLIYLQMLIDSWNTDEDIRLKTRALADILGYQKIEKISELRRQIGHDYQSLQWD
ncbi:MAG: PilZ domain-containing protein [Bacteriovoracia bacterium]